MNTATQTTPANTTTIAGSIETTTVDRQAKPTISRRLFNRFKSTVDLRNFEVVEAKPTIISGTKTGYVKRVVDNTVALKDCEGTAVKVVGGDKRTLTDDQGKTVEGDNGQPIVVGGESRTVAIIDSNSRLGIRWGYIIGERVQPMGATTANEFTGLKRVA